MSNRLSNQQQLSLRSIHTVLAIGFAVLLFLIWLIGMLSTSKLNQISVTAGESATDYKKRLTLALNLREAAVEVVAEFRVLRAGQGLKVRPPSFLDPFRDNLESAKKRFQTEFGEGKKLWGQREEYKTLPPEELKAWREVESAALRFWEELLTAEKLIRDKQASNAEPNEPAPGAAPPPETPATSSPSPQPTEQPNVQPGKDNLFDLRRELDRAAEKLSNSVTEVQDQILYQIVNQQKAAASDISGARWGTLLLGALVAGLAFIIVWKQIVELRQANRQEQEAKDLARSVFDSQSNDILVVNRQGELLDFNQAFLNHFKLSAPSLVLQDYAAALNHFRLSAPSLVLQDYAAALAHLPEISAFVRRTFEDTDEDTGRRERIEVKPRRDFGAPNEVADARLFDVYISPLTSGGQPRGRVIMLVDVTEDEQVREELRLSRSLSAVGQITATVAHELYNPIGAVKLNIDLLEMQVSGDEDVKHTIARLKRGVEHLSTIVMELRYLTRPRDPERKPTDLNKLLDEVVELAGDRLERSRVFVERKYSSWLPHGQFDPQQLRKVFLNLLINAVEASPQNSDVELHTHYISGNGESPLAEVNGKRGAVIISVIDHGVGMSPETKRRLFEAFYTTKRNGTGLGMMITQEIVRKHGGKIEVESEEGKGTTVSVYLPV
jgi:signal transduction histidine kinase